VTLWIHIEPCLDGTEPLRVEIQHFLKVAAFVKAQPFDCLIQALQILFPLRTVKKILGFVASKQLYQISHSLTQLKKLLCVMLNALLQIGLTAVSERIFTITHLTNESACLSCTIVENWIVLKPIMVSASSSSNAPH
jgi:hypothetical protein